MADENEIVLGFLNVVATPHPDGIYLDALKAIANKPVNFRGRDFAIVTAPRKLRGQEVYEGRVSVWTDIDSSEPSIDKATFEQRDVEQALKKIFDERGFNNRSFYYALDAQTHILTAELKNDLGKTISVKQAARIFEELLSSLNREGQTYEVTIVPEEDALERVLGFARLDRVRIFLKRPNPGDHRGEDAEEVLRELQEQNMKEAHYLFARQPGTDGIHLNASNLVRAEVAAQNGRVDSSGLDDAGEHGKRSTREYPKIVSLAVNAGTLFASVVRAQAIRFRAR